MPNFLLSPVLLLLLYFTTTIHASKRSNQQPASWKLFARIKSCPTLTLLGDVTWLNAHGIIEAERMIGSGLFVAVMQSSLMSVQPSSKDEHVISIQLNSQRKPLMMVSFTLPNQHKMVEFWRLVMLGELRDSIQGFGFECLNAQCQVDVILNDGLEGRMDFIDDFLKKRLTLFHSTYVIQTCSWRVRRVGLRPNSNQPWVFGHLLHTSTPLFYPETVNQDAHALQLLTRISKDPSAHLLAHEGFLWASRELLKAKTPADGNKSSRLSRDSLLRGSHTLHYRAPKHLAMDIRMAIINSIEPEDGEKFFSDIDAIWLIFAEVNAGEKILHLLFQLTPKQDTEEKRAEIHRWVTCTLAGHLFYSHNFQQAALIPWEWNVPLVVSLGHPQESSFSLQSGTIKNTRDLHRLIPLEQHSSFRLIMMGKHFGPFRMKSYSLVAVRASFKMPVDGASWSLLRRCFMAAFVHEFPRIPIVAVSLHKASDNASMLTFFFGVSATTEPILNAFRLAMQTLLRQEGIDALPIGHLTCFPDFPDITGKPQADALPPIPVGFTLPDGTPVPMASWLSSGIITEAEVKQSLQHEDACDWDACQRPVCEKNAKEVCEEPNCFDMEEKGGEVKVERPENEAVVKEEEHPKLSVSEERVVVKRVPKTVLMTEEIQMKISQRKAGRNANRPAKNVSPLRPVTTPTFVAPSVVTSERFLWFEGWKLFSPLKPEGSLITQLEDLEPNEASLAIRSTVDWRGHSYYSVKCESMPNNSSSSSWKSAWMHLVQIIIGRSIDWSRLFVSLEVRVEKEQVELLLWHRPIKSIAYLSPMIVTRELLHELIPFNLVNLSIDHK